MNNLNIVILAAGKGTRMKSDITKVCHKVGGKTMIEHVVNTSSMLCPKDIIIVVSNDNKKDIANLFGENIKYVIQKNQLGTGHAVLSAIPGCNRNNNLLVLLGDVPLIKHKTLEKVINTNKDAVIIGFIDDNINNKFGRIVIKNNRVEKIVEYLDATQEQRNINLCNSGMLWIKACHMDHLFKINNNNKKKEYYLTDIIEIMKNHNLEIGFYEASKNECMGVNNTFDLKQVNDSFNQYKE